MPSESVVPVRQTPLHPASGALILLVDWLFFGADVASLGGLVLLTSLGAFTITALGVFWIQRTRARDSVARAALKALFGGIVAGIPTSLGGTVVGTVVLAMAGLKLKTGRRV